MTVTTALLLLNSCRKTNDLNITVYNYALGEPVTDAEVVILQLKYHGGLFNATGDCKEIAHATTDSEGKCSFDNIKLKTSQGVQYAAKIKYAYGKSEEYSCNVTQNSEVKKNTNNQLVLSASSYVCYFKIVYSNLLDPAVPGDSLYVYMSSPKYQVPGQAYPSGGGGAFTDFNSYYDPSFPYP